MAFLIGKKKSASFDDNNNNKNDQNVMIPPVFSHIHKQESLLKGQNPIRGQQQQQQQQQVVPPTQLMRHASDSVVRNNSSLSPMGRGRGGGYMSPSSSSTRFSSPKKRSNSSSAIATGSNKTNLNGIAIIPPFQPGLNKSSSKISEQTSGSYTIEEEEVYVEEEYDDNDDEEGSYYEEIIIEDDFDDDNNEYIIEEEIIIGEDSLANLLHPPLVQPKHPTKISFDEYDEIQFTLNLNDYKDTELDNSWYKRDEYDKMVSTAKKLIAKEKKDQQEQQNQNGKRKNRKNLLSSSWGGEDTRGLEAWKEDGAKSIRELKERVLDVVWEEQSRQWEHQQKQQKKIGNRDGNEDYAEQMRQIYLNATQSSREAALQRGKDDELAAKEILRKDAMEDVLLRKRHRINMIAVGKALGKSIQRSKSVVGKTGRIVGRTTLGVATLDKRMIKESVSMIGDVVNSNNTKNNNTHASSNKNKRTSSSTIVRPERQIIRQKSTHAKLTRNLQAMNLDASFRLTDSDRDQQPGATSPPNFHQSTPCRLDGTSALSFNVEDLKNDSFDSNDDGGGHGSQISASFRSSGGQERNDASSSAAIPSPGKILDTPGRQSKRKFQKLKLLGLVPIPGTQCLYEEDLQRKRLEARQRKTQPSRLPSWETGLAPGKH